MYDRERFNQSQGERKLRLVRVVRNIEFGRLFESFFITAVSTILIVRFYLKVTGYPQIGGSTLHISHLLPGTLLLLVAVLVMLAGLNRAVRDFGAVVAGIGFGLSWDELGKFITENNNYLFKPTLGLIYLTFVLLYLLARYAARKRLTQDDYLANALDLIKEAAIKDLDPWEYEHAKELMLHVSPSHPMYGSTMELLKTVRPNRSRVPLLTDRITKAVMLPMRILSQKPFFPKMVVFVAFGYGLLSLFVAGFFFYGAINAGHNTLGILKGDDSDVVGALSAFITVICVAFGAYFYWRGKHGRAYDLFEAGLLIEIFVGQVILFFKSPEVAMVGLFITLVLFGFLRLLSLEEEHRRVRSKRVYSQPGNA